MRRVLDRAAVYLRPSPIHFSLASTIIGHRILCNQRLNSSALGRHVTTCNEQRHEVKRRLTMASADFCQNIIAPLEAISLSGSILEQAFQQISQGKTRDFPPTYPPHIRHRDPDVFGLRVYWPSRPRDNA